jgi:hypothetical protein
MATTWLVSFLVFCLVGLAISTGYDSTLAGLLCLANILLLLSPRLTGTPGVRGREDDLD